MITECSSYGKLAAHALLTSSYYQSSQRDSVRYGMSTLLKFYKIEQHVYLFLHHLCVCSNCLKVDICFRGQERLQVQNHSIANSTQVHVMPQQYSMMLSIVCGTLPIDISPSQCLH